MSFRGNEIAYHSAKLTKLNETYCNGKFIFCHQAHAGSSKYSVIHLMTSNEYRDHMKSNLFIFEDSNVSVIDSGDYSVEEIKEMSDALNAWLTEEVD